MSDCSPSAQVLTIIWSLVLEPADDLRLLPGQNVSVFVHCPTVIASRGSTPSPGPRSVRFQISVRGCSAGRLYLNGRMSTYLHDKAKVGDILDVSAPAGDFVLTPSVFPASPGSRRGRRHDRAADGRARCADTATATSDGGPRRNVPLKIIRFARLGISSTISTPTPGMSISPSRPR